jgi:membrane fusion protein (multidrug efflux system)
MKKLLYILPLLVIVAIIVYQLKSNKIVTKEKVYQYNSSMVVDVLADTLQLQQITASYSFSGSFEPFKETKLSAEIQGKINQILVDAGGLVEKGQPLVKLDDALLKLQLETVYVQISGLETDVKRYTVLSNADAIQGVQLEKAILALKAAIIQRNTLLEQVSRATVKAPFRGIVTAKLSEIGAFAAPGIPLLQLTDIYQLKFTVNVPENQLKLFNTSLGYSVKADAYPDLKFSSKIILTGSKGNLANSFPVQFLVTNTNDLKIKAGMFGQMMLNSTGSKPGIMIPASAITGSEIHPQVYLVKNGKAFLQRIVIDQRIQNNAVVQTGLKAGDILVTGGLINLFAGANVRVQ